MVSEILNARIGSKLKAQFKSQCALEHRYAKDVLIELIRCYLTECETKEF